MTYILVLLSFFFIIAKFFVFYFMFCNKMNEILALICSTRVNPTKHTLYIFALYLHIRIIFIIVVRGCLTMI